MPSPLPTILSSAAAPASEGGATRVAGEARGGFAELMQQQSALRAAAPVAATATPDDGPAPPAVGPRSAHPATGRSARAGGATGTAGRAPAEQHVNSDAAVARRVAGAAQRPADARTAAPPWGDRAAGAAASQPGTWVRRPKTGLTALEADDSAPPLRTTSPGTGPAAADPATAMGPITGLAAAAATRPADADLMALDGTAAASGTAAGNSVGPSTIAAPGSPPLPAWLQGQALVTGWRPAMPAAAATNVRPDTAAPPVSGGADAHAVDASAEPGAVAAGGILPASGLRTALTGGAMAVPTPGTAVPAALSPSRWKWRENIHAAPPIR